VERDRSPDAPEGKVCPETWALRRLQLIEEANGVGGGKECCRKQTTVTSTGTAAMIIVGLCGTVFRIVNFLDWEQLGREPDGR
jgi:hypothetical protein